MTDDSWSSVSSEYDFNLTSWLVQSKATKSQIDAHIMEKFRDYE